MNFTFPSSPYKYTVSLLHITVTITITISYHHHNHNHNHHHYLYHHHYHYLTSYQLSAVVLSSLLLRSQLNVFQLFAFPRIKYI